MLYQVHLTWTGFELTTLVVIDTDSRGRFYIRIIVVIFLLQDSVLQILAIMAARATEVITNAVDVHLILKEHDVNMVWITIYLIVYKIL
jgi:hypothetical protein